MVPHSGTPVRTHRLRPLNQPRRVIVELNARSLPIAVSEAPSRDAPTPDESPGHTRKIDLAVPLAPSESPGLTGAEAAPPAATRREVESVGEIWRVDDEWWRQPINRRYIEVVMKGGKHVVLYQDLNSEEWFEQSV
jgi:hypothetical protein